MKHAPWLALAALLLAACSDAPERPDSGQEAPPVASVPTTNAPADVSRGESGWNGIGETVFGMTAAEVRQSWGAGLEADRTGGSSCYQLHPRSNASSGALGLMIEDDKFVRYSVADAAITAPGGGRHGMQEKEIEALYPALERQPHKYRDGGEYLGVRGKGKLRLIFETDPDGVVTEWRVGQEPQVLYVEGCS